MAATARTLRIQSPRSAPSYPGAGWTDGWGHRGPRGTRALARGGWAPSGRAASSLLPGVLSHESLDALPGVGRRVGEFRLLAVEEAVRRARVDRGVVLDARLGARGVELIDDALRNPRIRTAKKRQHGARVARDGVDGLGPIRPAREPERPAVESDHAGVAQPAGRLQIRQRPTEAEADREDRADLAPGRAAQIRDRGRDVGLETIGLRQWHLRHEVEAVAPVFGGRRPREEVDGHRVYADLREAVRELLVIGVQPAHVRDDDHPGARRRARPGRVGHEARAVGRRELEVVGAGRASRDRANRRPRLVVNAHTSPPFRTPLLYQPCSRASIF